MDFAIIAAGEGSRLKKGGILHSKPMVPLGGVPLIERLMQIFARNGAERILVIINEHSPDVETYLARVQLPFPLVVIKKSTPSSLHSFHNLLPHIKSEGLCLTTVDTVFDEATFSRYVQRFRQATAVDGLMAVTPFVDDESPLYVHTDAGRRITGFDDACPDPAHLVSGGIYCLRARVFATVDKAIGSGVSRMRNFQRLLIRDGFYLEAFSFQKMIDIDRPEDLALAEDLLQRGGMV